MIAIQQALFDHVFTTEVYEQHPDLLTNFVFQSCNHFPGFIAPPIDSATTYTRTIRADFADPWGINPAYSINGLNTEHAARPTGYYLAPGSIAKVRVPNELVNQGYSVLVGAHTWDLYNKPTITRLHRIRKVFPITSTETTIFNPLGGAIIIQVPFGADDGLVQIEAENVVQAPFFSTKSFDNTSLNDWYNICLLYTSPSPRDS